MFRRVFRSFRRDERTGCEHCKAGTVDGGRPVKPKATGGGARREHNYIEQDRIGGALE